MRRIVLFVILLATSMTCFVHCHRAGLASETTTLNQLKQRQGIPADQPATMRQVEAALGEQEAAASAEQPAALPPSTPGVDWPARSLVLFELLTGKPDDAGQFPLIVSAYWYGRTKPGQPTPTEAQMAELFVGGVLQHINETVTQGAARRGVESFARRVGASQASGVIDGQRQQRPVERHRHRPGEAIRPIQSDGDAAQPGRLPGHDHLRLRRRVGRVAVHRDHCR